MSYWKVILATMVIFGTGVITGALVVRHFDAPAFSGSFPPHPPMQRSPGGARLDFLRRMQRELDLTAEQREQVDKLLKQSQERSHKIMEPVAPQLREEVQRAKKEFREVLTPAQQQRFDDILKEQQRLRERRGSIKPESAGTNALSVLTNSPGAELPATNSY